MPQHLKLKPLSARIGPYRSWSQRGVGPGFARLLLGLSVLLMMVPTFMFLGGGPLSKPLLMDGDKIVEMACPDCHGDGKVKDPQTGSLSQCPRCRGRGLVPFLIAGPKRFTQIIGHVYAPDSVTPVDHADVRVETGGEPILLKTDPHGQFGVTLPPGTYQLSLKAAQGSYSQPLPVAIIDKPQPVDRDLTFLTLQRAFTLQPSAKIP